MDDFERYIQAGGGYVGVHSATDTEYDWPCTADSRAPGFNGHQATPTSQKATYWVLDKSHVTQGFPDTLVAKTSFTTQVDRPTIHTLIEIDEKSTRAAPRRPTIPWSWYHDFDGGRAWYTEHGSYRATYSSRSSSGTSSEGCNTRWGREPSTSAARAGGEPLHQNRSRREAGEPSSSRSFPATVCFFNRATWYVNLYSPATGHVRRIATIPVSTKYADSSQARTACSIAADPNFRHKRLESTCTTRPPDQSRKTYSRASR